MTPRNSMMRMMMIRRRSVLPLMRRALSSTSRAHGPINLTPYASPLLLRLHPDRMQRHAARHPQAAIDNEDALKQLNQFLEIAAFGCNNDGFRARRQILALAAEHHDDPDAPIRWTLRFHVPTQEGDDDDTLEPVDHVVAVPAALVRRTLAHGARASSASDAVAAGSPFAREWQRATKRVLQRLFDAAHVPLYQPTNDPDEATATGRGTPTQLALWLEQEETEEAQYERGVAAHNAAMHRVHNDFDKLFVGMLAKEKNIVHPTTTGLEDGPTTQHVILTRLISQRLFLERIPDREEKRRVFFWLANILLMNFMELRLHALVWNKVVLMVTQDGSLETPQVMWDSDKPEQGMAVLIPADMDAYALVDVLYEHVQELELALNESAKHKATQARRKAQQQQRQQATQSGQPQPPRRKKKHFYSDEVNALFRKR